MRATPLRPRIPVDRATPWKLVPARVFLHAAIFVGVIVELLDWATGGDRLPGMSSWVYGIWAATGLAGFPMIAIAYWMVRRGSGGWRYLALKIETISNLFAGSVLAEYIYASAMAGYVVFRRQSSPAWCVLAGVVLAFTWVLYNDVARSGGLERRAKALEHEDHCHECPDDPDCLGGQDAGERGP